MIKRMVCTALLAVAGPLGAQTGVDTAGAGANVSQAMNHSEVMKNHEYLADGTVAMSQGRLAHEPAAEVEVDPEHPLHG